MSPLRNDLLFDPLPNDDIPAKITTTTTTNLMGPIPTTFDNNEKVKKGARFQDDDKLVQDDVLHRISHLTQEEIQAYNYTVDEVYMMRMKAEMIAFEECAGKLKKKECMRGLENLAWQEGSIRTECRVKSVVMSVLAAQARRCEQVEIAHESMANTTESVKEALERGWQDYEEAKKAMSTTRGKAARKLFAKAWKKAARGLKKQK